MQIPSLKIAFTDAERGMILSRIDQALQRGALSQGAYVGEFEERFAAYTGARHAIAVNSGSSAIEIVMRALGVEGGEVLVPTNTFLATATGVLFAGGQVRLVDTDPRTMAVSLDELKRRATSRTVGVIVVHIGGIITPEIERIRAWCDQQGFWLFEDAAHAHGSRLNGRGAGTFGIAGAYSFFATKVMTSGEGGMIVTDDDDLAQQCRLMRNHGKPEPWVSYHTSLGTNYRLGEVAAAIGLAQLDRLDEMITARQQLAEHYTRLLSATLPELELVLPPDRSSWYKYIVMLPAGVDRAEVKQAMKARGIGLAGETYELPLHRQPVLAHLSDVPFPNADSVCDRHICLPIYPTLTFEQAEQVVQALAEVLDDLADKQLAVGASDIAVR